MTKTKKKIIIFFSLVMAFCVCGVFLLPIYLNSPIKVNAVEVVEFRVEEGESLRSVIKRLKNEKIIRSETYALLYSKWKAYKIKTGVYDFSQSFSTNTILGKLNKGGREDFIKVTVPEGLTITKTAKLFEKMGVCSAKDFISVANDESILKEVGLSFKSAEGFLFPDTYLLTKKDNAKSVIRMMVKNFFAKTKDIPNFPKNKDDMYDTLKLASIVEREYQLKEEANIISGVFVNRLNIKMPLQSCATVEYVITEIKGKPHPKRLFWEDIQINNEYNTYIHQGLPPSPIANPGIVSLNAACNPKKTNYLYFRLIDAEVGRHAFSTNVSDHNKIGNAYLLKR